MDLLIARAIKCHPPLDDLHRDDQLCRLQKNIADHDADRPNTPKPPARILVPTFGLEVLSTPASASVKGKRYESVLGLGYLSRYRVTLDFPGDRIYLERGKHFGELNETDLSGASVIRIGRDTIVRKDRPSFPVPTGAGCVWETTFCTLTISKPRRAQPL